MVHEAICMHGLAFSEKCEKCAEDFAALPDGLKDAAYVLERGTALDVLMEHGKFWLASELISKKQEIVALRASLAAAQRERDEARQELQRLRDQAEFGDFGMEG